MKCLAHKPEGLSLNPRTHVDMLAWYPRAGEVDREPSPASQTSLFMQPRAPARDPDSKKQGVGVHSHGGAHL